MTKFMALWIMIRGLFFAFVIYGVLFVGDPNLLDAVIGWIERQ